MKNYNAARKNMVDCQLETSGVVSDDILGVFQAVPREEFLPAGDKCKAYIDEDILFTDGRFIMEPMSFARMLEVARIQPDDIVLNIGDLTGYSSAVLSSLVTTIVTLEAKSGQLDDAIPLWAEKDFCNIAVIEEPFSKGCPDHAPYSLIIINGSVECVDKNLLNQLSVGGRLVTVIKPKGQLTGCVTLIERTEENDFSSHGFFDASTPYLDDFKPKECFVF